MIAINNGNSVVSHGNQWVLMALGFATCRNSQKLKVFWISSVFSGCRAEVFSNVHKLSFLKDTDEENGIVIGKWAWLLRSIFGFVVNLLIRDFVGYSVPILLMNFHNPIDCVIYSVPCSET